jgi:hypothetical protein
MEADERLGIYTLYWISKIKTGAPLFLVPKISKLPAINPK